jgi:multidrug transporter EmrE-like cation transporter
MFEILASVARQTSGNNNAKIALDISQISLCIVLACAFVFLSHAVRRVSGKSPSYYAAQGVGIAFVVLAVLFLAIKAGHPMSVVGH